MKPSVTMGADDERMNGRVGGWGGMSRLGGGVGRPEVVVPVGFCACMCV